MSRIAGAGALVVAGIVAAAVVGQLPAIGAEESVRVASPASAAQALVCPGPAVAVGAVGTGADDASATGRPSRTRGTAGDAEVEVTPFGRGDVAGGTVPRLLSAPAADSAAGAIAGAQSETVSGGDAAGLAATACTPPTGDAWFVAGATTTGRTTVLTLTNPSTVGAQVAVRVWSEQGPVEPTGDGTVTVPANGRRTVSLAGLAPAAGGTAVRVTSRGGRIGAALEQRTVRGLESGGVDVFGATAAPARRQVVPGLRVAGAATVAATQREDGYADLQPVVRVLVPGSRPAEVAIRVRSDGGGEPIALGRRVEPGIVTDFPVPGLGDGTYTVEVEADRPFVTGARVSVVGDPSASAIPDEAAPPPSSPTASDESAQPGTDAGLVGGDGPVDTDSTSAPPTAATSSARGIDLAWFAAAERLGETATVAVVGAPAALLTIESSGEARTVRLSGAVETEVQVPAGGAVSVPVSRGVVVLAGAAGTTAGVSYAGTGAIAGYPVAPADQRARPVRISD